MTQKTIFKKGFTLIELLVVMAIIALLLLGTLAGLTFGLKKARDTRRQKSVAVINSGLQAYYAENNLYVPYTAITANGGTCTQYGSIRRCDITALVGLNDTGSGPSSTPSNAPLYVYFEEEFQSPIGIQAGKDLDNAMGYYVDDSSLQYAVCVVTELESSGNVTPAANVNDEGTNWGCYCVGPLAQVAQCKGLEDPNGLPN